MLLVGNSIFTLTASANVEAASFGIHWGKKSVKKDNGISNWLLLSGGKMGFDEWFDSLVVELEGHVFSECHALDYL